MTEHKINRPWLAMVVLGVAQLMITLDNSIVTIALPSAQADLGFGDALQSWIISAYALTFASLLLVAGRLLEVIGHRRAFIAGLLGFSVASIIGGFANGFVSLVFARAMQGVFAALLAPATLSLLLTTFPSEPMRARALGVFAASSISGTAIGMVLGGALTEFLNWRWCMFVNLAFAAAALIGAGILQPSQRQSFLGVDSPGAITAVSGLFVLVLALSLAETQGWTAPVVIAGLAVSLTLLAAFWRIETSASTPILPPHIVANRTRGPAFLAIFIATIGLYGVFLFLTYIMQRHLGFSPLVTGLGFLPMVAAIMFSATQVPIHLLPKIGPKRLIPAGLIGGAVALFWLSQMGDAPMYFTDIAAPLVVMGLGTGTVVATSISTAAKGIMPNEAGVASATINTMMQIGAAAGAAFLTSIAGLDANKEAISGYGTGFLVAGTLCLLAALACAVILPAHQNRA